MTTGFVYSDRFLEHDTGAGHPERPDRLRAVMNALRESGLWEKVEHIAFEASEVMPIERVHDRDYIDRCRRACESGLPFIDVPDSAICPASFDIARLAVGAVLAATDQVMTGRVSNAMCLVRPPGHHAERDRSMGFCLFNNVAVAAQYVIDRYKIDRVAIVDFDVHHGNGTQHTFEDRSDVLFISLHQDPATLYPGTGFVSEIGAGEGKGYTMNVVMQPNGDDAAYQAVMDAQVLPKLDEFAPEVLLVSAGFDASDQDPLAQMRMTPDGFAWIGQALKEVASRHCGGKLLATLEGGYDLERLAESVVRFVEVLLMD